MGEVLILRHCWRDAFFCVCVAVDRFLTIGRRTGLPPLRPSGLLPHATRRALCALAGTIRTEIRGDDGRTLVACGPLLVSEDPESRWTKKPQTPGNEAGCNLQANKLGILFVFRVFWFCSCAFAVCLVDDDDGLWTMYRSFTSSLLWSSIVDGLEY